MKLQFKQCLDRIFVYLTIFGANVAMIAVIKNTVVPAMVIRHKNEIVVWHFDEGRLPAKEKGNFLIAKF